MKKVVKLMCAGVVLPMMLATTSVAQEVCYSEANQNVSNWIASNGKTLGDLIDRYNASADPDHELINYNGVQLPITSALLAERAKYEKVGKGYVGGQFNAAEKCAGRQEVAITRGTYDLAREALGLTTILPERATRIDFEEIRRGNLLGGKNSGPRTFGRQVDKALNPFRW